MRNRQEIRPGYRKWRSWNLRAAFGANYPRLAQVKKKYDPTNFFSINQNIQPAA
jgi:FAD/FMN-containing dehydrogenase